MKHSRNAGRDKEVRGQDVADDLAGALEIETLDVVKPETIAALLQRLAARRFDVLFLGAARTEKTRQSSEALLAGKLFDDRGNRMSPTWARKGSKRWRYYVSQAALQGDKSKAGSIVRVPAAEVEALVTEAVGKLSADRPASQIDIRDRIDRVAIGGTTIQMIRLSEVGEGDDSAKTLTLPWTAPSPYRRREIIQGASDATTGARPMRGCYCSRDPLDASTMRSLPVNWIPGSFWLRPQPLKSLRLQSSTKQPTPD